MWIVNSLAICVAVATFWVAPKRWLDQYRDDRRVKRAEDCLGALYDLSSEVARVRDLRKGNAPIFPDVPPLERSEDLVKMWVAFSEFYKRYQLIFARELKGDNLGEWVRCEVAKDIHSDDPGHKAFYVLSERIQDQMIAEISRSRSPEGGNRNSALEGERKQYHQERS
jgi:hypothetical protein